MKNILLASILSLPLLFAGCVSTPSAPASPNWYATHSLQQLGYIIGYGEGATLAQAKTHARADLAKTLKSQIQAQTTSRASKQNGVVDQSFSRQITELSNAQLNDLQLMQSQQIAGSYFVALGMDIRPLAQRVLQTLQSLSPAGQASIFHSSALFVDLQQTLGYFPELRLIGDGQHYFLETPSGDTLKLTDNDSEQLFPVLNTPKIDFNLFSTQQRVIQSFKAEQLYSVRFNAITPGYLSYLQVFANGDTVLLFANQEMAPGQNFHYPDLREYDGLVAELPSQHNERQTTDLHLAILCPDKRDFQSLENLTDRAQPSYAKQLHKLPALLNNCHVQTKPMKVLP